MSTIDQATAIFVKYYKEWESNANRMEYGYVYKSRDLSRIKKIINTA